MRSKNLTLSLVVIAAIGAALGVSAVPAARADDVYTFVVKKQEEKRKSGWSLQEWLNTRDRMRLMDLWLAMHSPSPYEFYLGGSFRGNEQGPLTGQTGWDFHAAAYAKIFGLDFSRQALGGESQMTGGFNLRIFGYHAQTTNITLQAGVRSLALAGGAGYRQAYAGPTVALNLAKYFGLEGMYRHYFDSVPGDGGTLSATRMEAGAFLDFNFVRVRGGYFWEPREFTGSGGSYRDMGFALGARIYF